MKLGSHITVLVLTTWMLGCTSTSSMFRPASTPSSTPLGEAGQLVVVTTTGWDATAGELRTFMRDEKGWRETALRLPVVIGRAGSGWGIGRQPPQGQGPQKREGDGRSPAGVFDIGPAFGYETSDRTHLPYRGMKSGDYCIDVPESPWYNRIVSVENVGATAVAGSTEPMRRDLIANGDEQYRLGFVILHNASAQPGQGSCIFAHLWKGPDRPTAGCTAMDPTGMRRLLDWLRVDRNPRLVLLPMPEYRRLQPAWGLPELGDATH